MYLNKENTLLIKLQPQNKHTDLSISITTVEQLPLSIVVTRVQRGYIGYVFHGNPLPVGLDHVLAQPAEKYERKHSRIVYC